MVAVVTLVGLGSAALLRSDGDRADRAGAPLGAPTSLAVLPFVDLSEGGDREYLADGITEELLLLLSGVSDLRVPARSSSFYFKGKDLPVQEIAGQLGVDALVIGTLRTSGQRLRITAQLVDGREDRHLWSEAFDLETDDLFDAPVLIAHKVARALSVQLGPPGGNARSRLAAAPDPRAHDAYLRGLFHWNRRSAPDLELALRFFEEATRLDPDYARAWAGLTLVYAVLPINFTPLLSVDEAWERLEAAAARALALDPELADVHAARGLALHFAWRWDEAEAAFRRALELDPSHPTAHQWYGEHLAKLGRGDEGVASVRRAIALDPLSLVAHNDLGLVLMISNRLPEAAAQWDATVRMDPAFFLPHFFLHRVHLMTGELEAAAAAGRRWAELTGTAPVDEILALTEAVGDASLRPGALEILEKWAREPRPRYHDIAFYLVLLDETDAALRILERGVEARHPMMAQLIAAPWVDPLRGDPRLDALLAIVRGGPPSPREAPG
jgi:TolB-like protein